MMKEKESANLLVRIRKASIICNKMLLFIKIKIIVQYGTHIQETVEAEKHVQCYIM
jgi:hypothetical protein